MKFRTGDRVKFLNDVGTGKITGFPDNRTATVLRDDGFEVPVLLQELIPSGGFSMDENQQEKTKDISFQAEKEAAPQTKQSERKPPAVDENLEIPVKETPEKETIPGKYPPQGGLAWIRTTGDEGYSLYLVNDSSFHLLYTLHRKENRGYRLLRAGKVEPDTKIRLYRCDRQVFGITDTLHLEALVTQPGVLSPVYPVVIAHWERGNRNVASELMFHDNPYFDAKAWMAGFETEGQDTGKVLPLETWQEMKRKGKTQGMESTGKPREEKPAGKQVEEVDLHLEAIVDHPGEVELAEALEIQKSRFVTALEGALRSGTKKMVFIHGVGDGKLKYEIRRILDRDYPRLKYQDASFREYGYGATMVIFP